MISLTQAVLTLNALVALFIINRAISLWTNYTAAKKIGLPIVMQLGSWQDPLWVILGPTIKPLLCRWGIWDANAIDYSAFGWPLKDHFATHARLGHAFTIVTPFKNNVIVADAEASKALYKDWHSWIKDPMLYSMMEAFGKNVNSVNGSDWQRHRKVTAPAFKEANSKLVWKASLAQADGALNKWAASSKGSANPPGATLGQLRTDTSVIAMHVLSYAGMGKEYSFGQGLESTDPEQAMSYATAMKTVVSNISPMLVPLTFAATKLPPNIVPTWLKQLQTAVKEVRLNLKEAVEQERQEYINGGISKDNLLSTLVRANEAEKDQTDGKNFPLNDEELYGNLFIFNMAGHETTSSALSYAIPLLAVHPEAQEWIREEIDAVFHEVDQNNYNDAFPRLVRCTALLYETLRFFAAVPIHPKYSGNDPQVLRIRGTDHPIPAHTYVSIHQVGIHFDPSTWGPDVDYFEPKRFVNDTSKGPGREHFVSAPAATDFFGFAGGPRVCPGKRFSTVEFVAVIAKLLSQFEVRPAIRSGESDQAARKRLEDTMFDIEFFLSPHYVRPEDAGVVCVERKR